MKKTILDTNIDNEKSKYNILHKRMYSGLENLKMMLDMDTMEEFIVYTIESLMLLERDEYLKKIRINEDEQNLVKDKANGFYARRFISLSSNKLMVKIPRTRKGEFEPLAMEMIKSNKEQVYDLGLLLYRKGMSSRDTEEVLQTFFGEKISHTSIANMAREFNIMRMEWEKTKLESHYKVVLMDAMYIVVRRDDEYRNEAVHIAVGYRDDGKRELVHLSINPTESNNSWEECIKDLKENRGVKEIDLFVADGVKGLENIISKYYANAKLQKCVVHKIRNVLLKVRPDDKSSVAKDLRYVFDNFESTSTIENAKEKLYQFIEKHKKTYPEIKRIFNENEIDYYFTYIKFPKEIRRNIYTTNAIENLNRSIRKGTKNKLSFEKPEYLLDYVFTIIKDFEEKNWSKYPITTIKNSTTKIINNF